MIGLVILAALLQQQGPRSLDIDPSKVQPPVVVAGERKGEATVQGDSSKGEDAKTVGTTAAQGALIGVIADRGRGAAVGGGVGAAAGAAAVLLTRGKDLVLEPGTTIEIVLDRP